MAAGWTEAERLRAIGWRRQGKPMPQRNIWYQKRPAVEKSGERGAGEGKSADKPGSVERTDREISPPGNHSSGRRVAAPL